MMKHSLKFKNSEIVNTLLAQLNVRFPQAQFSFLQEENSIASSASAINEEVQEHIDQFESQVGRLAGRVSSKMVHTTRQLVPEKKLGHVDVSCLMTQVTDGVYWYTPEFSQLMDTLDKAILKIANDLGARNIQLPSLLPTSQLASMGYLPRDEAQVGHVGTINNHTAACCLTPAVCLPLYPTLKGRQDIRDGEIFTVKGKAHRYEGGRYDSNPLMRLREFSVREFILFREKEREDCLRPLLIRICDIFSSSFDLPFKIQTATDLFFEPLDSKLAISQLLNESKWELRVAFDDKELAVGSYNNHDDHFTKLYQIGGSNETVSSCVGIGLERLAYALVCTRAPIKDLILRLERQGESNV